MKKEINSSSNKIGKIKNDLQNITNQTSNIFSSKIEEVNKKIKTHRDVVKQKENQLETFRNECLISNINALDSAKNRKFVTSLGKSPTLINDKITNKIKKVFPIPVEQIVIWVDAEFDLKPSGIALTNKGIFIRSNVDFITSLKLTKESKSASKIDLYFYSWHDFEPSWFIEDDVSNTALQVESPHHKIFVEACMRAESENRIKEIQLELKLKYKSFEPLINSNLMFSSTVFSTEKSDFIYKHSSTNSHVGHGFMAESYLHGLDLLKGKKAKLVGVDNVKNGADRIVNGKKIQTKFHSTARSTINSLFDDVDGKARYLDGLGPMKVEVPKDQYEKAIDLFADKIKEGKVPNVSDPSKAKDFIIESKLTHAQSKNLAKAGNIDSLKYDAASGAVLCFSVFSVSLMSSLYQDFRAGQNIKGNLMSNTYIGAKNASSVLAKHITINQVSRTGLQKLLLKPSTSIANILGPERMTKIANASRAIAGKSKLYGAAAKSHGAKILRSNTIILGATYALMSIPDTYRMVSNSMSISQYSKNMSKLSASLAGSVAGTFAVGAALSSLPNPASIVIIGASLTGGMVGGTVASKITETTTGVFSEDDIAVFLRLYNVYITTHCNEYLLNESETDQLFETLSKIESKVLKQLSIDVRKSKHQEEVIREFLEPIFDDLVSMRKPFIFN